jgi:hypothetical protein
MGGWGGEGNNEGKMANLVRLPFLVSRRPLLGATTSSCTCTLVAELRSGVRDPRRWSGPGEGRGQKKGDELIEGRQQEGAGRVPLGECRWESAAGRVPKGSDWATGKEKME